MLLLLKNDVVKFQPNLYSLSFDKDVMIDKGLMTEDGYVYGIVANDAGWQSDFNPYSESMKINMFIWKDNKIQEFSETCLSSNLIIINTIYLIIIKCIIQLHFNFMQFLLIISTLLNLNLK